MGAIGMTKEEAFDAICEYVEENKNADHYNYQVATEMLITILEILDTYYWSLNNSTEGEVK